MSILTLSWEGKKSNAIRLGNLLNKQDVEKTAVKSNDVRKELYELMEERQSDGLDPKPTDDILDEFVTTYPHISRKTIGQWISHHDIVGGRMKPMRTYTTGELANQRYQFGNLQDYKDHQITEPRTLDSWDRTAISSAFVECMENNKKKALIIFYCSTMSQVDKLINTDIKKPRLKSTMQNLVSSGGFKWILYSFVTNDVTVIKLVQATTGAALPALY